MSDPTEAALRAIEDKYLPLVMEGKALMPFYARGDVSLMIAAAVAAEREACAQVAADMYGEIDRDPDDYVGKDRHSSSWKSATMFIAAAIRKRGAS